MKDVVILQDHAGYRQRVRALQAVHPRVYPVTPADKPNPWSTSFTPPEEWLPQDQSMPYWRRCWWKADAMGLAAVKHLDLNADFFWFIESDVVAAPDRWKALFDDFRNDPSDLVAPSIRTRAERPNTRVWQLDSTPEWARHYILMAVFRLSRRALLECTRCAVEMRDCFSEVAIPSVVHRAGLSMTGINVRRTHCNTQTFAAHEEKVVRDPRLINHPVKANTAGVPA